MSNAIPYTVKVINASQDTKTVPIFDKEYKDKYVIVEAVGDITYEEMMYQMEKMPFKCAQIFILWRSLGLYNKDSSDGIYDKFDKLIKIQVTDANGTRITIPYSIKVDPFQQQTNVTIIIDINIPMDQTTRMIINIPGESSFEFSFYTK